MTLEASGAISLAGATAAASVEEEIYGTSSATISLNDANVRTLLGVASGAISLSSGYNKSWYVPTLHSYLAAGTFTFVVPAGMTTLNVLVIAGAAKGGGSGTSKTAGSGSGAGGAQALQNVSWPVTPGETLTIVVAASSGGSSSITRSSNGANITSAGSSGGSYGVGVVGATSGAGYAGGAANSGNSGGGGGNGGVGGAATSGAGGVGGVGTTFVINGTSYPVGYGGHGGDSIAQVAGAAGAANTGNGGSGCSHTNCCTAYIKAGGLGGSGAVYFYG